MSNYDDEQSMAEFHVTNLIHSPELNRKDSENNRDEIEQDLLLSEEEINDFIQKLDTSQDLSMISTALVVSSKCSDERFSYYQNSILLT